MYFYLFTMQLFLSGLTVTELPFWINKVLCFWKGQELELKRGKSNSMLQVVARESNSLGKNVRKVAQQC